MRRATERIFLMAVVLWMCGAAKGEEAKPAEIPLQLSFSAEGGDFKPEPPAVASRGKLIVRVSWAGFVRPDDSRQPYLAVLTCPIDFASANNGIQSVPLKGAQQRVYLQRPDPSWLPLDAEQVDFHVDLGERPEGVMGQMNKWDAEAGKFVDAELPPCSAIPDGEHMFAVKIYYKAASGSSGGGTGLATFTLPVGQVPASPSGAK